MPPRRRRQLLPLAVLMFAGGFAELATISATVPFIMSLTDRTPLRLPILDISLAPISVTALFISAVATAGLLRLLLLSATNRFAFGLGHELTVAVQRKALGQPYLEHVRAHSSTAIAALEKVEILVFCTLLPTVQAISAAVLASFLLASLLLVDLLATLVAVAVFASLYTFASFLTRPSLRRASHTIATAYDARIKLVQESHAAIRQQILDGSRERTIAAFRSLDERLRAARVTTTLIGSLPRIVLETLGVVAIALLTLYLLKRDGSLDASLPILAAFALGAQRLLPLGQLLFKTWADASANRSVVADIVSLLNRPTEPCPAGDAALSFRDAVEFRSVSFSYPDRLSPAVTNLSFALRRGSRVALAGPSGSGKSTVADLLMGLLTPDSGEIRIDGRPLTPELASAWQRNLAHVPQQLFLADHSIEENISVPGGRHSRAELQRALRLACLDQVLEQLPDGLATRVGQDGLLLSGGQRQRVALAQAIVKSAPLLILDEPTSALDAATEKAVLQSLDHLQQTGTTILIIAHRPAILDTCDEVIWLRDGRIERIEAQPFDTPSLRRSQA